MTNEWNTRNLKVIEEFRANAGKVAGGYTRMPVLLLTTRGARTGRRHTTPLAYSRDGERLVVIASKGGSPTNPDWYHNLVANPQVTVEVGAEKFEAWASVLQGDERDRAFRQQAAEMPFFADYEKRTPRKIPVIALARARSSLS
jgi:deazaflavin-dependent oxidoreductase (nitroreductase family)